MSKTVESYFWDSLTHEDLKAALRKATDDLNIVRKNYEWMKEKFEEAEAQLGRQTVEKHDWMHALKGLLPSLGYHGEPDPAMEPRKLAELVYATAMGWEDRAKEKFYDQQDELENTKRQRESLLDGLEHVLSLVPTPKNYPEGCPIELEPAYAVEQRIEQYEQTIKEMCERADEHQKEELVSSQRINELQTKLAAIHVAHQGPVPGCHECENRS